MRALSHLAALRAAVAAAAALAACSIDDVTFTQGDDQLAEDCSAAGDEDGNGLADCSDPACAGAPACPQGCGDGVVETGEVCDDGDTTSGDGCDANCTPTGCGNGIVTAGEQCDDGNTTSGDGCNPDCTFSGHAVPPSPAVWLRFDDPPGDGVLDSGLGVPASCTSCPLLVAPGKFGNAYRFLGMHRIDVAPGPPIAPNAAFTIAAWVRIETPLPGPAVIGCKNLSSIDCTYALQLLPPGVATFHSAGAPDRTGGPALQPMTWHHLAMTWDGAVRIGYVDGLTTGPVPVPMMPSDVTTVLSIGARRSPASEEPFNGSIDELLFYNRVLSAAELAQLATP